MYSPAGEDADSGGGSLHTLLLPPQHCLGETCWPMLFMKLYHKIEYFFLTKWMAYIKPIFGPSILFRPTSLVSITQKIKSRYKIPVKFRPILSYSISKPLECFNGGGIAKGRVFQPRNLLQ